MAVAVRRRAHIASALVIALVAATVAWFAVRSDGATVHETELNDGGIWVSNSAQAKIARFNAPIVQLETAVALEAAAATPIDVLQDGAAVVGVVRSTGALAPVDTRLGRLKEGTATVPGGSGASTNLQAYVPPNVALKGGTIAIVEPKSGRVWAQRVSQRDGIADLNGLAMTGKPLVVAGGGAALTVDVAGNVHVVSAVKDQVVTIPVAPRGFGKPITQKVTVGEKALDISAVGDRWVVYDTESDTIAWRGGSEPQKAGISVTQGQIAYAALQQPGPPSDRVAIEGVDAARFVTLGNGSSENGGVAMPTQNGVTGNATGAMVSRPVVVGTCLYAAWALPAKVVANRNCGEQEARVGASIANPAVPTPKEGVEFRVNRNLITLNDKDSGSLWDVENKLTKIDDWDVLTPPSVQDDKNIKNKNVISDDLASQPPEAKNDDLRARAGRTSVLHVLDNDTDPSGGILAIAQGAVIDPKVKGVAVSVSGDGQAINLTVAGTPEKRAFSFGYEVNNGKAKAKANVQVTLVDEATNSAPVPRPGGTRATAKPFPALPGGEISVGVVGDWRDPESDPVSVEAASATSSVNGSGRLQIAAPTKAGTVAVPYAIVDDHGALASGQVQVQVIDVTKAEVVKPITQPDAVRGVVGKPLQVDPLANDIAGADSTAPEAQLSLAAEVADSASLQVDTNLDTGTLTMTAASPGTYQLSYGAQQGTGITPGRIRVDITAPDNTATPPIAVGDSMVLRDQSPALVDVLANDSSPRADVLVTQSVQVSSENAWLRPSIFQGRWVRVEATDASGLGADFVRRGTVSYSISDGTGTATGTISVVQRGPLSNVLPAVRDDQAAVRVGDVVTIPVLDNDTMSGGIPLRIDPESVKVVVGGTKQNAFASGNTLRYAPEEPDTLAAPKQVTLEYAAYPEGSPELARTGRVTVTVNPLPTKVNPNQAPVARSFSSSVTSGDAVTLTVPTSGVDRDGDSVSIIGIVGTAGDAPALSLGRIVTIGPSTIRYEAYPSATGSELITYAVTDRFGGTSQATIRVGVVPPGDPQPPVAVQDDVVAAPGKKVTVPFTENDLISRGSAPTVEYQSLNSDKAALAQWKVDADQLTASTTAPEQGASNRQFTYGLNSGLFDPSTAAILVRGQTGFNNRPVAQDDVAKPALNQTTAVVDVLANDRDIDSDNATLTVGTLGSPNATVAGQQVRVKILDHAYAIPYTITDVDGGTAMAFIYVPTGADGAPFVVDKGLIEMDQDSTKDVELNDYVKSPRDREVSITAVDTATASPARDLTIEVTGAGTLKLTSANGYAGPAAVMLEVTDKPRDQQANAENAADFGTAYVSIPVQIGPKVAVLRCPDFSVQLLAGGRDRVLDLPTLCNAWVPIGMTLDGVVFTTDWESDPGGVGIKRAGAGQREITLTADEGARGGQGRLTIGVRGSDQKQTIGVTVIPVPGSAAAAAAAGAAGAAGAAAAAAAAAPPSLRPVSIQGLKEGASQQVDLRAYLTSPLKEINCSIVSARVESGKGLTASSSGCVLTVTAGANPDPKGSIALSVTDKPGSNRQATGRATVTMLGRPGAPTGVTAVADRVAGGQARVSWLPPSYNGGSPIMGYTVTWDGGSQECGASPCTITGLKNGQSYVFRVVARNAIGESDPSAPSLPVKPDTLPGQPQPPVKVSIGDGQITFRWAAPTNQGSAITSYRYSVVDETGKTRGVQTVPGSTLQATESGLTNNNVQKVRVQAVNELGAGPWSADATMQSAGNPAPVGSLRVTPSTPTPGVANSAVSVDWNATDPNGPPLKGYTVNRRVAGGGWVAVANVNAQTLHIDDSVPYDGQKYEWMVTATNGADLTSAPGNVAGFSANGIPDTPAVRAVEAGDNKKVNVTVGLGPSRSTGYSQLNWSTSSGQSGTHACPCAGTVTFTIGPLPTENMTVSVKAVNNGGLSSAAGTSNTVKPYGPTLKPTNLSSSRSGNTITWTWNTPQNGRPIDQTQTRGAVDNTRNGDFTQQQFTGQPGNTYKLEVRVHSEAGWSPWAGPDSQAIPAPPPPTLTIDGKGQLRTGVCANCRQVNWHANDTAAGAYHFACFYNRQSTAFYHGNVTVGPNGGWSGDWCAIDPDLANTVKVVISGGPSGTVESGWHAW